MATRHNLCTGVTPQLIEKRLLSQQRLVWPQKPVGALLPFISRIVLRDVIKKTDPSLGGPMSSLTEREMTQIAKVQLRDKGTQRLSHHFCWPEFNDERRQFHQEFVYDVAMFAVDQGFSWANVIQAAVVAKILFPQLDKLDAPKLLAVLRDTMSQRLLGLTAVNQFEFVQHITQTFVTCRRLFQVAVSGDANVTMVQRELEVEVPPRVRPLRQGTDLHEWEAQYQRNLLILTLQQKEEQLKNLREKSRVTLGDLNLPEDDRLDREDVLRVLRASLKEAREQMEARLDQESQLVGEILQLKLQQATATPDPSSSHDSPKSP